MTLKISNLLVVVCLYLMSFCSGRDHPQEQVMMTMRLSGQFNSERTGTAYHCYVTNSTGTFIESSRKINTRNPANKSHIEGPLNPSPPKPVFVSGLNANWRIDLNEEYNNDFGVFGCRATQAGRRETEIFGIFMRSDADLFPEDELFTKTVSLGEGDVSIGVTLNDGRISGTIVPFRWLKDNYRNRRLDGTDLWHISRPVTQNDAGVYECHLNHRRDYARQALKLLIVTACRSGRWRPPGCNGICDNCYNGGICDDKTGRCICAPGFMGPNCLTGCGSNRFGYQCELTCDIGSTDDGCRGNQFCLVNPYGCRCNTGFKGLNCLSECEDGKYGAGCLQKCHCQNQGSCNRFTGQCDLMGCEATWSGQNCQVPDVCPVGYYGRNCTLKCLCQNNSPCEKSTGECANGLCAPGSSQRGGSNCEVCDDGFFGDSCNEECHCTPDACDTFTGECDGGCLHQWIDSPPFRCQDGITGADAMKVNPGAESLITCRWIETIVNNDLGRYQMQLSRSQELFNSSGISLISNPSRSCLSTYCNRSKSFTISSTHHNDQFYCQLKQIESSQIVAWLKTFSTTFVLPVLSEPPEVINRTRSSITIRWKPWNQQRDIGDPPVVGYVTYYRETSETAIWMLSGIIRRTDMLQFTYSSLRNDSNYEFSVAASRDGMSGLGSRSPSVTSKTLCNKPSAVPYSVLVENVDVARLNISWKVEGSIANCSTGITSFIIYFTLENSNDEPQMLMTSNGTWIIVSKDDGLQPGQRYIFSVSLVTDQESTLSQPSQSVILQPGEETPIGIILTVIAALILIAIVIICVVAVKRRKKPQPVGLPSIDRPGAVYANDAVSTKDEESNEGIVMTSKPPDSLYMVPDFDKNPPKSPDSTLDKFDEIDLRSSEVPVPQAYQELDEDEVATKTEDHDDEIHVKNEADGDVYENVPRAIPVADVPAYFRANADKLNGEFQQLKRGQQFPWTVGAKYENTKKNRFRMMFTYDHSRVVLDTLPNDDHSDYYNASHIKDHEGNESFIASQAPNRASLNDFWRMIWKEEVYTIVMLTNLNELGKDRCTQYWPEKEGTSRSYGDVVVSWAETEHYADFDIRKLRLSLMEEMRTVYQLHYSTWPDKNIPRDKTPLMELIKMTKLTHRGKTTPILTHCSAGIGRTGTFISIYCLMEVIKTKKEINVFGFVEKARQNRINMVQTEAQYSFIYKCLADFCLTSHTEIPFNQLSDHNTQSVENALAQQFQLLNQFDVIENSAANGTMERSKDRYQDSGPNEMGRVFLMSEGSSGFSNYINATLYRTVRKTNAFIATQAPLPHTVEDFWRLVYDWKSSVIVMLNQLDPNDKTCVEYWPSSDHAQYGRIGVSCLDSSKYSSHIRRKFEVCHSSGKSAFTVCQLQLLQWPEGTNLNLWKELIQTIRLVQMQEQNLGPMLVHCKNGVQRSSIFVAVETALQYFEATGSLDLFNTIREMRQRNSHVIQDKEDYQLCFDILQFLLHPGDESYENVSFNQRNESMC